MYAKKDKDGFLTLEFSPLEAQVVSKDFLDFLDEFPYDEDQASNPLSAYRQIALCASQLYDEDGLEMGYTVAKMPLHMRRKYAEDWNKYRPDTFSRYDMVFGTIDNALPIN